MYNTVKKLLSFAFAFIFAVCMLPQAFAYNTGDDYPDKYASMDDYDPVRRFYYRQCTDFCAWCLRSRNGVEDFTNWYGGVRWGQAKNWKGAAESLGIPCNNQPAVGAIACWSDQNRLYDENYYGHVAWVEAVNGNEVTIEEYNINWNGQYNKRTISSGDPTCYIHISDIPTYGTLDVNFLVNGREIVDITGIGTFDVACNGSTLTGQTDYCRTDLPNGAAYTISNIKPSAGYNYTGLRSGSDPLSGTIAAGAIRSVWLCFESKKYTVSFDANGGTGAPPSQTKIHGTALDLSSTVPTRINYDFVGWATSPNAAVAMYQPGGQYNNNTSVTLYALWKVKNYTITFDPNGGTVNPVSKSVVYNEAYGILPVPTKAGCSFDGWYTDALEGTLVTYDTRLTVPADQTLYAHWSPLGEMVMPVFVAAIEEEAFMGDSHISHVEIPESCSSIGSRAFADCENLVSMRILGRNTTFESDTFAGSPNVVIYCYGGSRAQRLASADGLEYHLIGVDSDWVSPDTVPHGAEIIDRKWTYIMREYTDSSSSSYPGWTKYDSKITSWTGWSGWQNSEISASSDRQVRTQTVITGYNMISYCVSGPQGRSYQPSPTYSVRLQHGPYWWSKAEFDSARVFYAGSYFDYESNVAGYVLDGTGYCKWDGSDNGGYVPMFIQDTTYGTQWSYRDAVYTYSYYRDVDKESSADPSGQDNVSNIQEWVKYRY